MSYRSQEQGKAQTVPALQAKTAGGSPHAPLPEDTPPSPADLVASSKKQFSAAEREVLSQFARELGFEDVAALPEHWKEIVLEVGGPVLEEFLAVRLCVPEQLDLQGFWRSALLQEEELRQLLNCQRLLIQSISTFGTAGDVMGSQLFWKNDES